MQSPTKIVCPKCGERKPRTRHHVYPQRFYGRGKNNTLTIDLCQSCHTLLERMIPKEKMPDSFYINVVWRFLDTMHPPLEGGYNEQGERRLQSPNRGKT